MIAGKKMKPDKAAERGEGEPGKVALWLKK